MFNDDGPLAVTAEDTAGKVKLEKILRRKFARLGCRKLGGRMLERVAVEQHQVGVVSGGDGYAAAVDTLITYTESQSA